MSIYDFLESDPRWVKLAMTIPYPNTGRWFWQTWKPRTIDLPVYRKCIGGECIYLVVGRIGNRTIRESIENV